MTVGIYIRVSTEEQAQEGYSISAQRERLKAFCIAQNWNEHKFYVDEGISGRSTNRPQFKKLMKDIEDGLINVLLVYRLDRLTRSVRDLHKILDHIDKYNCVFRSATEIYDTSTAMGRMFITIVAAIAEWESANLGERVKMGQIEKAHQKEWAAQPPYGFYKDDNHKLHQHETEIKAVKLMIQKVREGFSFRQLAFYMDSTDYKPRRGYKWHIRTLMDLMHNPALYGAMRWRDEIVEDTHEGIMAKEEFEQLQKIIDSRKNTKKRDVKSVFVYQTKIVCPDCGNRCTSERSVWKRKTDGEQRERNNYRCQICVLNRKEKVFRVSEIKVDEALLGYLNDLVLAPSNTKIVKETNPGEDLLIEMKKIENQREKYQRAWASDLITDNEFKERMNESRIRYEELKSELEKLKGIRHDDKEDIEKYKEIAQSFSSNFSMLTQEERRSFVQTFIERIDIDVIEHTKAKGARNQKIKVADIRFY